MNYKAKRADEKGWVEGSLIMVGKHDDQYPTILQKKMSGVGYDRFEVIPETVCQFTGETATSSLDGIDPKIWNGDIFEFETIFRTTRRLKVVYKKAAFYAVMIDDEEISYLLSDFLDDTVNCKVGNIYDETETV
jgi:hypothetical protein